MRSLFALMKINLPVPEPRHTCTHRRCGVDSTGLKIYGKGERKVRQHRVSKRRTWRKLHAGANPEDGEIQAVLLTENSMSDDEAVEALLVQIEQGMAKFAADGAYDKRKIYDSLSAPSPTVLRIPPQIRLGFVGFLGRMW